MMLPLVDGVASDNAYLQAILYVSFSFRQYSMLTAVKGFTNAITWCRSRGGGLSLVLLQKQKKIAPSINVALEGTTDLRCDRVSADVQNSSAAT